MDIIRDDAIETKKTDGNPPPLEHQTKAPLWTPPKPPDPPKPKKNRLGQAARLAIAFVIIGVGGFFLYDRFLDLTSTDAFLASRELSLRTPIDGTFTANDAGAGVGSIRNAGQIYGTVTNDRVDTGRLLDLQTTALSLRGEIASIEMRQHDADQEMEVAREEAQNFTTTRVGQLTARISEADSNVQAAQARLRQSDQALDRAKALFASHAGPQTSVEQAVRDHDVAMSQLAAAVQQRAALATELNAAQKGTFSSDTASDRSASQQTYDRMRFMKQELTALLNERKSHLDAVQGQIKTESDRISRLTKADIVMPVRVRILRQFAQSGEFVHQGAVVAQVVDCSQPIVTVAVDERRFRELHLGQKANFRPISHGRQDGPLYPGKVIELRSPLSGTTAGQGQDASYKAILRLTSDDAEARCMYGVMGQVSFQ